MKGGKKRVFRFLIPLFCLFAPFLLFAVFTKNMFLGLSAAIAFIALLWIYVYKLYCAEFDPEAGLQKRIFALLILLTVLFSFAVCASSIEDEWLHEYPLERSVDSYGCYPQMFDAFMKGQLNIDTEYDLAALEALNNPYNPDERRLVGEELYNALWDRAYFEGKLYSYFGVAPVFLLYFPAYFLTGCVLSDALAAALLSAIGCLFLMLALFELCKRMVHKPPFLLFLLAAAALPWGSLIWVTQTNANFYHIAVQGGICSVSAFFWLILKAESCRDGVFRKLLFALAGVAVALVAASRPTMLVYVFIAFPLLISVIKERKNGLKSLLCDIAAFCMPMLILGVLIMLYNFARFGSAFDFGQNYQLTLNDVSQYSFSFSLILPALYHYFAQLPEINGVFPYIHRSAEAVFEYSVPWSVYITKTVGAFSFPAVWSVLLLPLSFENKRKGRTAVIAVASVVFLAIFNMCFAGVHLRYTADIMFVIMLLCAYLLLLSVGQMKKSSGAYVAMYTVAAFLLVLTVVSALPLCLENERNMIAKHHPGIYVFFRGY